MGQCHDYPTHGGAGFLLPDDSMKETYYFSHDFNAGGDPKIVRLLMKMGAQGYGLYWLLIEKLYQEGGRVPADFDLLAYAMGTQRDAIASLVGEFDLFFVEQNEVGSRSVDRRLKERQERSESGRAFALKRWGANRGPVATHKDPNARKESKEKKVKSISAFAPPTLQDVQAYCQERKNNVSPERFLAHYEANGWVQGNSRKPIKNWKAAVITWEQNNFGQGGTNNGSQGTNSNLVARG